MTPGNHGQTEHHNTQCRGDIAVHHLVQRLLVIERTGGVGGIGRVDLLDDLRAVAERAQRAGDFEQASRILYGEIPTFEEELERVTAEVDRQIANET